MKYKYNSTKSEKEERSEISNPVASTFNDYDILTSISGF